jgi:hypothetical protein
MKCTYHPHALVTFQAGQGKREDGKRERETGEKKKWEKDSREFW